MVLSPLSHGILLELVRLSSTRHYALCLARDKAFRCREHLDLYYLREILVAFQGKRDWNPRPSGLCALSSGLAQGLLGSHSGPMGGSTWLPGLIIGLPVRRFGPESYPLGRHSAAKPSLR